MSDAAAPIVEETATSEFTLDFIPEVTFAHGATADDGLGVVLIPARVLQAMADAIRIEGWEDETVVIGHGHRPDGSLYGRMTCKRTEKVEGNP